MSQLALFDAVESPADSAPVTPDEVTVTPDGYVISLYLPQERHFKEWLRDVDETIMDMTGYSIHDFAVVPTFGGGETWPDHPRDAALAVLRQDVWGQAFLGDLDLK